VESAVAELGMVIADRYRLDAEIGHGGYSRVFRATEIKLGREVALKLLSRDSVDEAGAQRFQREAELARCLGHPNTVRLLDFDIDGKPSPYIVFELLNGESLHQLVRRGGPMPEERVARLTMQVLKSLMEAHAAGIVHRDMKPGNVFVCTYAGEPDFVKVLDFGIAKSTDIGGTALTAAGTLVGTPRYMPPEQIRGAQPSPAMDVYAVGMMMAEMLAGAPVLRGTPMDACLKQLANDPIELPEAATSSTIGPVLSHAVDKDLAKRYGTAEQMLRDIERLLPSLGRGAAAPPAFAPEEEPLPSNQVATTFMVEPVSSGRANTVFAPLQAPVPREALPTAPTARPLLVGVAVVLTLTALVMVAFTAWFIVKR
jgi:eukaryotic-like serine/threonine-protein kinase